MLGPLRSMLVPLALAAACASPSFGAEPHRLKVVGGLAGMEQYTRFEEPFWTRELPRLSGGRLAAEIVPFDRAGIELQDMLRLVQLGTVAMGTALLNVSGTDPELLGIDLAGLNPDVQTLRQSVDAYRPYLVRRLRERYGAELLAVYIYPAQMAFCREPLAGLDELAGRRVRVSGTSQSDFVSALGAKPVQMPFAQVMGHVAAGSVDCVVTGSMSGNTIGLHEATSHLLGVPLGWGVGIFVANGRALAGIDAELQLLLRREVALLERAIWAGAEAATGDGVACNAGEASCRTGKRGRMKVVRESRSDARRRREILVQTVIPAWLNRCGAPCAEVWAQTLGRVHGQAVR